MLFDASQKELSDEEVAAVLRQTMASAGRLPRHADLWLAGICAEHLVNTPSAKADGFSGKLCGTPLAWRLTERSIRKFRPLQNHTRSRNVTVECAAAIAAMHPFTKKLGPNRAAVRACLARAARIDEHDSPTSVCSFVGDVLDELSPPGIVDGLGEHTARKPFNVQIFHSDVREMVDDRSCELMRKVSPLIGDSLIDTGDPDFRLCSTIASALPSRQCSLGHPQSFGGLSGMLRRCQGFAVRQGHEACEAYIDADRTECSDPRGGWRHADPKTNIPFAVLPTDDRSAWLSAVWQRSMPFDLDFSRNAENSKTPVLANRQAISKSEVGAVIAIFGSETRKARFDAATDAPEEGTKSLVETPQYLLLRRETVSSQSFIGDAHSFQFRCLLPVSKAYSAALICLDSLLQSGIVEIAECTKHGVQSGALRCGSVKPILVRSVVGWYLEVSHGSLHCLLVRGGDAETSLCPAFVTSNS
jgi:hypothetical protein